MVFVIDTSSSMAGEPLAKAKEVVRRALGRDGARRHVPDHPLRRRAGALGARPLANARATSRSRAPGWTRSAPGGGTEMTSGIAAALDFPHDPARLRHRRVPDRRLHRQRGRRAARRRRRGWDRRGCFSFGVGSAVNRYLLEEMARIGRGAVQVVRPDEDTRAATARSTIASRGRCSPTCASTGRGWTSSSRCRRRSRLFMGQPLVRRARYGARAAPPSPCTRARPASR
jgi:Ca-activated chloride channel family protein